MPALVPVHGGLTEPVCRTVPADQIASFVAHAKTLTQVPVSDADLSTVYRLGDGGLSPLTGPMDSKTYHRVLEESVIEHQGKLYAWTIPIALPVTAELAARLKPGQEVALVNSAGQIVATLELSDVYPWDKAHYLKTVYLTERTDHPGGDMVLKGDADKTHLLGGNDPRAAAAQAPALRQVRALAARGPQAVREPRAGTASSPSRPAIRCTAPTSTPWSTGWKRCSGPGTTPAPCSIR